ncbi:MAG: tyrosine/phenylalanine carboxypeptidase domain-containing protein [Candidatus Paceibacterota bacterium]
MESEKFPGSEHNEPAEQGPSKSGNWEQLDDKWYERFQETCFDDYEYLHGDSEKREHEKERFLSVGEGNPTLDYPKLEDFDFEGREQKLVELKGDVLEEEENDIVRQLYRWRVNEELAKLRMLKAAQEGDDNRFMRYSDFIYGEPSPEIFTYTLTQVRDKIESYKQSDNEQKRDAARKLELLISWEQAGASDTLAFSADDLPDSPKETETITSAEEVREYFEEALRSYGLHNWDVVVDESGSRSGLSVSQETRTVNIPSEQKLEQRSIPLTKTSIEALAAHEIGTHARRRDYGEQSRIRLLGLGFDRYVKGEEGVATYEQQKIEGADDFAGLTGHLAISLAKGMDGTPRDFRQTFEVLKQYFMLTSSGEGEALDAKASELAWKRTVRTFRGSTCATPGACFTKDIVYREGNIGVWDLVKQGSDEMKRVMIGKYDPTNLRHVWVLEQLNITEEDLERIKKQFETEEGGE